MGFSLSYEFSLVWDVHSHLLDKTEKLRELPLPQTFCPHFFMPFTVSSLACVKVRWKDEESISSQYLFSLSTSPRGARLFFSASSDIVLPEWDRSRVISELYCGEV